MADRKHLHFRLLDAGLTYHQAVLFLIAITVVFGFSSLFLQSQQKLVALIILGTTMFVLAVILVFTYKRKKS